MLTSSMKLKARLEHSSHSVDYLVIVQHILDGVGVLSSVSSIHKLLLSVVPVDTGWNNGSISIIGGTLFGLSWRCLGPGEKKSNIGESRFLKKWGNVNLIIMLPSSLFKINHK